MSINPERYLKSFKRIREKNFHGCADYLGLNVGKGTLKERNEAYARRTCRVLSDDQVREIRELYKQNPKFNRKDTAIKYNTNSNTIISIIKGNTYKDVI